MKIAQGGAVFAEPWLPDCEFADAVQSVVARTPSPATNRAPPVGSETGRPRDEGPAAVLLERCAF